MSRNQAPAASDASQARQLQRPAIDAQAVALSLKPASLCASGAQLEALATACNAAKPAEELRGVYRAPDDQITWSDGDWARFWLVGNGER